jgi:branched-chain amino acid transport system substrate-binding protein
VRRYPPYIAAPSRLVRPIFFAVVLAAWGVGTPGCKPRPPVVTLKTPDGRAIPRPAAPPQADEADAARQASAADAQASRGQADAAERTRDALLAQHPGTEAAADVRCKRAERASADGRVDEAIALYEQVLFLRPGYAQVDRVRERYATLLRQANRQDDALKMLQGLYHTARLPADRLRLGAQLGQLLADAGRGRESVELAVDLSTAPGLAPNMQQKFLDQAAEAISGNLSFSDAEALWKDHNNSSTWAPLQPLLAFKLAKIYFHTRDYDRSEQMLQLVISRFGKSAYAGQAQDFLALLRNRFAVDTQAVGVLLPLSGKFKQYGERSLQAIQLGFAGQTRIKLVVRDTQGDPSLASQAVESLVLESHVVAIVGPLFSTEALAAALKAEELNVPLVALSFRDGLPQVGSFVFRNALTIAAQAKALAKQAFDTQGMTRFAILYPRSRYGIDFMMAFWDEVVARHGEIRGVESYEPDQTTFREPVRKLVGRWFLNARPEYKEAIDNLRKQKLPPMRMRSEVQALDKKLGPVVDFDAIVLPDSGRQIGLVTPALAFEDIVLTHNPRTLDKMRRATGQADLRPVTLLGASTWNTTQTLDSCEQYCEDAIFVDAFFAGSPDPKLRDFVAAYHALSGADPYLIEAQAYDTAGLMLRVLQSKKPTSRATMRDALLSMPNFPGITGDIHFDAEGEAQRSLSVLTIKDHTIQLLSAPTERQRG